MLAWRLAGYVAHWLFGYEWLAGCGSMVVCLAGYVAAWLACYVITYIVGYMVA